MTDTDQPLPPLSGETLPLYLPLWKDGVLDEAEEMEVLRLVEGNAEAEAVLDLLERSDAALSTAFSDVLTAPLPLKLARIAGEAGAALNRGAVESAPVQTNRRWMLVAASAALAVGAGGGYFTGAYQGRETALRQAAAETQAKFGWKAQIAGYHRLYSAEDRHLVAIAANEADHIQTWIGKRTGRNFTIPDLEPLGLQFRGARLLAVNGTPTAQLMYVPIDGSKPIGLCFLRTGKSDAGLIADSQDGFDIVTWRKDGFSFIAIGSSGPGLLREVAETAEISL